MSKYTQAKLARKYAYEKEVEAEKRTKHIVTCPDGRKIEVLMSPGQIINQHKLCKI